MECCPFCGRQLISCGCCYRKLDINVEPDTPGFDAAAYVGGLTREQNMAFEAMLERQGLVPWVPVPLQCVLCGELWPNFFRAEDWNELVPPPLRRSVLCYSCFLRVAELEGSHTGLIVEPRCSMCGSVTTEPKPDDWDKYVPPIIHSNNEDNLARQPMCKPCFEQLKAWMPDGWRKARRS